MRLLVYTRHAEELRTTDFAAEPGGLSLPLGLGNARVAGTFGCEGVLQL